MAAALLYMKRGGIEGDTIVGGRVMISLLLILFAILPCNQGDESASVNDYGNHNLNWEDGKQHTRVCASFYQTYLET